MSFLGTPLPTVFIVCPKQSHTLENVSLIPASLLTPCEAQPGVPSMTGRVPLMLSPFQEASGAPSHLADITTLIIAPIQRLLREDAESPDQRAQPWTTLEGSSEPSSPPRGSRGPPGSPSAPFCSLPPRSLPRSLPNKHPASPIPLQSLLRENSPMTHTARPNSPAAFLNTSFVSLCFQHLQTGPRGDQDLGALTCRQLRECLLCGLQRTEDTSSEAAKHTAVPAKAFLFTSCHL